jgi:hypothetical protein
VFNATDVRIPWNEWGESVGAMEIPGTASSHLETVIHGARMLAIAPTPHGPDQRYYIDISTHLTLAGGQALPYHSRTGMAAKLIERLCLKMGEVNVRSG